MYPNDADGNAVRAVLAPRLAEAGFEIVDPGAYETGTTDYSAQIALFRREAVEDLQLVSDPVRFRGVLAAGGAAGPAPAVQDRPGGEDRVGSLGPNIASAAYWHRAFPYASPLTGLTGDQLADGWEAASGEQWTQQLGATMSLLDAGFEALKASADPKQKASVAEAIATLKTTTMIGKVDFTAGPVPNVSPAPIIGTQWVEIERRQVPSGLRCHRERDRSERSGPGVACFRRGDRMTLLAVKSLDVRYGQFRAVRDVSLDVEAAEVVALIGANGAGKTTFLRRSPARSA